MTANWTGKSLTNCWGRRTHDELIHIASPSQNSPRAVNIKTCRQVAPSTCSQFRQYLIEILFAPHLASFVIQSTKSVLALALEVQLGPRRLFALTKLSTVEECRGGSLLRKSIQSLYLMAQQSRRVALCVNPFKLRNYWRNTRVVVALCVNPFINILHFWHNNLAVVALCVNPFWRNNLAVVAPCVNPPGAIFITF